ncbi:Adenine deaminase [Chlamydiales bacterium STE3]|nr:Adenine deaminase [Chlamydiales bacterium STE3]
MRLMQIFKGNIVDLIHKRIYPGSFEVDKERILNLRETPGEVYDTYIVPGFVDAHVHVESSMLPPSEFARLAVPHGTVAVVSDPHEIANVLGLPGIRYMVENGQRVPFHFYFGAPSCVPATTFETSGAHIGPEEIEMLFLKDNLIYLSEMMNWTGVLKRDPEVMRKLAIARALGKSIDGHAPGLMGHEAQQYIAAGISTDHECFSLQEALDKIHGGMRILIREGSAAKNYAALHPLLKMHPAMVMFCSDDKHPHDLVRGHINDLVKRSIVEHHYDPLQVLSAASLHPIVHYGLGVGLLQEGDSADFIIVDNLQNLKILNTYVKGYCVAEDGISLIARIPTECPNNFSRTKISLQQLELTWSGSSRIRVIEAVESSLITNQLFLPPTIDQNCIVSDTEKDLLKLVVANRYNNTPPAVAFVKGFNLQKGAIASSVAHDSHNIIAVGTNDFDLLQVINALIDTKGGIAVANQDRIEVFQLPIAGLMSDGDGYQIAERYEEFDQKAKELGTFLTAPFMTLSFLSLLVIPKLKLSDKGLFDGENFCFVPLEDS